MLIHLDTWTLDSDYLKQTLDSKLFQQTTSGINIELKLYFQPQRGYEIAQFINNASLATIFGILMILAIYKSFKLYG
jgi:hypothetical protein